MAAVTHYKSTVGTQKSGYKIDLSKTGVLLLSTIQVVAGIFFSHQNYQLRRAFGNTLISTGCASGGYTWYQNETDFKWDDYKKSCIYAGVTGAVSGIVNMIGLATIKKGDIVSEIAFQAAAGSLSHVATTLVSRYFEKGKKTNLKTVSKKIFIAGIGGGIGAVTGTLVHLVFTKEIVHRTTTIVHHWTNQFPTYRKEVVKSFALTLNKMAASSLSSGSSTFVTGLYENLQEKDPKKKKDLSTLQKEAGQSAMMSALISGVITAFEQKKKIETYTRAKHHIEQIQKDIESTKSEKAKIATVWQDLQETLKKDQQEIIETQKTLQLKEQDLREKKFQQQEVQNRVEKDQQAISEAQRLAHTTEKELSIRRQACIEAEQYVDSLQHSVKADSEKLRSAEQTVLQSQEDYNCAIANINKDIDQHLKDKYKAKIDDHYIKDREKIFEHFSNHPWEKRTWERRHGLSKTKETNWHPFMQYQQAQANAQAAQQKMGELRAYIEQKTLELQMAEDKLYQHRQAVDQTEAQLKAQQIVLKQEELKGAQDQLSTYEQEIQHTDQERPHIQEKIEMLYRKAIQSKIKLCENETRFKEILETESNLVALLEKQQMKLDEASQSPNIQSMHSIRRPNIKSKNDKPQKIATKVPEEYKKAYVHSNKAEKTTSEQAPTHLSQDQPDKKSNRSESPINHQEKHTLSSELMQVLLLKQIEKLMETLSSTFSPSFTHAQEDLWPIEETLKQLQQSLNHFKIPGTELHLQQQLEQLQHTMTQKQHKGLKDQLTSLTQAVNKLRKGQEHLAFKDQKLNQQHQQDLQEKEKQAEDKIKKIKENYEQIKLEDQNKIHQLEAEYQKTIHEQQTLQIQNDKISQELAQSQKQVQETRAIIQQLHQHQQNDKAQLAQQKQKLIKAELQQQSKQDQISILEQKNSKLLQNNTTLIYNRTEDILHLFQRDDESEKQQKEVQRLQENNVQLQQDADAKLQTAQRKQEELQSQLSSLQVQLQQQASIQRNLTEHQDMLQKKDKEIQSLKKQLSQAENDINSLRTKHSTLFEEKGIFQRQQKEFKSQLSSLQVQLQQQASIQRNLTEHQDMLQKKDKEIQSLKKQGALLNESNQQIRYLQDQLETIQKDNNQFQKQLQQMRQLETDNKAFQAKQQSDGETIKKLYRCAQKNFQQHAAFEKALDDERLENQTLKDRYNELETLHFDAAEENQTLKIQNALAQEQLNLVKIENNSLQQQLNRQLLQESVLRTEWEQEVQQKIFENTVPIDIDDTRVYVASPAGKEAAQQVLNAQFEHVHNLNETIMQLEQECDDFAQGYKDLEAELEETRQHHALKETSHTREGSVNIQANIDAFHAMRSVSQEFHMLLKRNVQLSNNQSSPEVAAFLERQGVFLQAIKDLGQLIREQYKTNLSK